MKRLSLLLSLSLVIISSGCGSSRAESLTGGPCIYEAEPSAVLNYVSAKRYIDQFSDPNKPQYMVEEQIIQGLSGVRNSRHVLSESCKNEFESKGATKVLIIKIVNGSCIPEVFRPLDLSDACADEFSWVGAFKNLHLNPP